MREVFVLVRLMLLVREAMYYIIGPINKTFSVLTSFLVYVWKQREYIIFSNTHEKHSIPEKKMFSFGWSFSSFILKLKNSNKVLMDIAIHCSFAVA